MIAEETDSETKMLGREPNVVEIERTHKELAPWYRFLLSWIKSLRARCAVNSFSE